MTDQNEKIKLYHVRNMDRETAKTIRKLAVIEEVTVAEMIKQMLTSHKMMKAVLTK